MGGGDQPPQQSSRSELNDMLNASPETQFMGNQGTPTPTPSPTTQQASTMTLDILKRLGVFS